MLATTRHFARRIGTGSARARSQIPAGIVATAASIIHVVARRSDCAHVRGNMVTTEPMPISDMIATAASGGPALAATGR